MEWSFIKEIKVEGVGNKVKLLQVWKNNEFLEGELYL